MPVWVFLLMIYIQWKLNNLLQTYYEVIVYLISGRDKVIAVVLLVAVVTDIGVHLLSAVETEVWISEPVIVCKREIRSWTVHSLSCPWPNTIAKLVQIELNFVNRNIKVNTFHETFKGGITIRMKNLVNQTPLQKDKKLFQKLIETKLSPGDCM